MLKHFVLDKYVNSLGVAEWASFPAVCKAYTTATYELTAPLAFNRINCITAVLSPSSDEYVFNGLFLPLFEKVLVSRRADLNLLEDSKVGSDLRELVHRCYGELADANVTRVSVLGLILQLFRMTDSQLLELTKSPSSPELTALHICTLANMDTLPGLREVLDLQIQYLLSQKAYHSPLMDYLYWGRPGTAQVQHEVIATKLILHGCEPYTVEKLIRHWNDFTDEAGQFEADEVLQIVSSAASQADAHAQDKIWGNLQESLRNLSDHADNEALSRISVTTTAVQQYIIDNELKIDALPADLAKLLESGSFFQSRWNDQKDAVLLRSTVIDLEDRLKIKSQDLESLSAQCEIVKQERDIAKEAARLVAEDPTLRSFVAVRRLERKFRDRLVTIQKHTGQTDEAIVNAIATGFRARCNVDFAESTRRTLLRKGAKRDHLALRLNFSHYNDLLHSKFVHQYLQGLNSSDIGEVKKAMDILMGDRNDVCHFMDMLELKANQIESNAEIVCYYLDKML